MSHIPAWRIVPFVTLKVNALPIFSQSNSMGQWIALAYFFLPKKLLPLAAA
jgi:hypothetical protein